MTNNYDNVITSLARLEEERDLVKAKLEISSDQHTTNEFTILTGTCPRKDRYIIERLLFRKTHGHSYIIFKDRDREDQRDMFICFVSKGVYKNISNKINNLFNLNKATIYDLPNLQQHLVNYEQELDKRI